LGQQSLLTRPMVALVGARNASSLGTRMAKSLAAGLAEAGYVVVSGLARGIDTAAHLASLDSGTIAVMAGGVDVIYPVENAGLAQDIRHKGLRISEMPMGMPPQARHFPARKDVLDALGPIAQPAQQGHLDLPRVPQTRKLKDAAALHSQILDKLGHPRTEEEDSHASCCC